MTAHLTSLSVLVSGPNTAPLIRVQQEIPVLWLRTSDMKYGGGGGSDSAVITVTGAVTTCHRRTWILPTALLGQETAGVWDGSRVSWHKEGTRLVFMNPEATPDQEGVRRNGNLAAGLLRGRSEKATLVGQRHLL